MKLITSILPLLFLPSCTLTGENPTLTQPSRKNLSGTYVTQKTSLFTSHRKEIEAISLSLKNDGSFRLIDPEGALVLNSGPNSTGHWKIVSTYGLDLGSRKCWGVQLIAKDDLFIIADCIGNDKPDKLLIHGTYIRNSPANSYFIMKKDEEL